MHDVPPHDCPADPAPEDLARAGFYTVLAQLLLRPDPGFLERIAQLPSPGTDTALARAWGSVIEASRAGFDAVAASHEALFFALGTPPVNPYESRYVHGTLMDHSLALLRQDLARLGLARTEGERELEDHLGALCEAMRALILRGVPLSRQADFFGAHLRPWAASCLDDIARCPQAGFYVPLAAFARLFLASEWDDALEAEWTHDAAQDAAPALAQEIA